MSWEPIDVNANAEGVPWISIGVHGKKDGYAQMKLTMSRTVVRHLGLKSGDQVRVERGRDDHEGWIQLWKRKPHEKSGATVSSRKQGKGNLAFRMSSRHLDLPTHSTTKITMHDLGLVLATDRIGPSLIVELPEWAGKESYDGAREENS